MIRKLVDFALDNRFLVLAAAVLLFIWGGVAFHNLPVEAYPDVADNYVEIVTQWPGISAEQMEQQVTIPLEIVMNGIPHVTHLRSFSLFGLSDIKLVFDDDDGKRLEPRTGAGAAFAGHPAAGRGRRWRIAANANGLEPGRPDLFLHAAQHESRVRPDGAEVDRRLGGREEFQGGSQHRRRGQLRRPHARISGARGSRQADLLRAEHRAGGAAAHQQQRQCRRQLHRSRPAADQHLAKWAWSRTCTTSKTPCCSTKNGTPLQRQGHRRGRAGPQDPAGPVRASAIRHEDGKIIDNDDVVSGIVLLRKGRRGGRGACRESTRKWRS